MAVCWMEVGISFFWFCCRAALISASRRWEATSFLMGLAAFPADLSLKASVGVMSFSISL